MKGKLITAKCTIVEEGDISGTDIDAKKVRRTGREGGRLERGTEGTENAGRKIDGQADRQTSARYRYVDT